MIWLNAELPQFLRPYDVHSLVRVGRQYDGGYVIDERSIQSTDLLIGLGIAEDWSFEEEFLKLRPVPLVAYDPTISHLRFVRRIMSAAFFKNSDEFRRRRKIYSNYKSFFSGNHQHIRSYVGNPSKNRHVSLSEILRGRTDVSRNVFAKIDIEGSEYEIIDDITNNVDAFSGLVIELHDVSEHFADIEKLCSMHAMKICHLHVNNGGGLDRNGIPNVIEVSFTPHLVGSVSKKCYPSPIDSPNTIDLFDLSFNFERQPQQI